MPVLSDAMKKMSIVAQRSSHVAVQTRAQPQVNHRTGYVSGSQLRSHSPQTPSHHGPCVAAGVMRGSQHRGTSPTPPVPHPQFSGSSHVRARSVEPPWSPQWPRTASLHNPQSPQTAQKSSCLPRMDSQGQGAQFRDQLQGTVGNVPTQPGSNLGGAPLQRYNSTSSLPAAGGGAQSGAKATRKSNYSTPEARTRGVPSSLPSTPSLAQSQRVQMPRSDVVPSLSWTPILQRRNPRTESFTSQNHVRSAGLLGSTHLIPEIPPHEAQSIPSSARGSPASDARSTTPRTAVPEEQNAERNRTHQLQSYMAEVEAQCPADVLNTHKASVQPEAGQSQSNAFENSQRIPCVQTPPIPLAKSHSQSMVSTPLQSIQNVSEVITEPQAQACDPMAQVLSLKEKACQAAADHAKMLSAQTRSDENLNQEEKFGLMEQDLTSTSGYVTPLAPARPRVQEKSDVSPGDGMEQSSPQAATPQKAHGETVQIRSPQTRSPQGKIVQTSHAESPYRLINVEHLSPLQARSPQDRSPQARSPQARSPLLVQDKAKSPTAVLQAQHLSPTRPRAPEPAVQLVSPSGLVMEVQHLSPASNVLDAHVSAPSQVIDIGSHFSPTSSVLETGPSKVRCAEVLPASMNILHEEHQVMSNLPLQPLGSRPSCLNPELHQTQSTIDPELAKILERRRRLSQDRTKADATPLLGSSKSSEPALDWGAESACSHSSSRCNPELLAILERRRLLSERSERDGYMSDIMEVNRQQEYHIAELTDQLQAQMQEKELLQAQRLSDARNFRELREQNTGLMDQIAELTKELRKAKAASQDQVNKYFTNDASSAFPQEYCLATPDEDKENERGTQANAQFVNYRGVLNSPLKSTETEPSVPHSRDSPRKSVQSTVSPQKSARLAGIYREPCRDVHKEDSTSAESDMIDSAACSIRGQIFNEAPIGIPLLQHDFCEIINSQRSSQRSQHSSGMRVVPCEILNHRAQDQAHFEHNPKWHQEQLWQLQWRPQQQFEQQRQEMGQNSGQSVGCLSVLSAIASFSWSTIMFHDG